MVQKPMLIKKINLALSRKEKISFSPGEIISKLFCFSLIVFCAGLPLNNTIGFLIVFISGLAIVNAKASGSLNRMLVALAITSMVFFARQALPHPGLQEGHNLFLIRENNEILEKGLPPEVFSFMKGEFLKRYSVDKKTKPLQSLYAYSADSVFSMPKYSRAVDSIDFNNLTEFRGGFVNNTDYNWYGNSEIKRESMPFFAMYELTPASVGSSICWTGYLLWPGPDGHYQPVYNQQKGCRIITGEDSGKMVFASGINIRGQIGFVKWFKALKANIRSFFSTQPKQEEKPKEESPLSMHLALSPFLRLAAGLKLLLSLLGAFFVLKLLIKVDWQRFLLACIIIAIAASIVYLYCPQLFGQYYIHEGGEDGLTHETLGRVVLRNSLSGNWLEALRAGQDVFWDTPGFRYFRAIEKFIFGDTDLGYLAVVLLLPYVLFGFLSVFISKKWSFWVSVIFLLTIFLHSHELEKMGFTYYIYVMIVRGGWPDVVAYTAFLGAITLALKYIEERGGAYYWYGFWAYFLLFVAVFMRPQFAVTALIPVFYFAWRLFKEKRFKEIAVSLTGFLPAAFPFLHNYFFGHKLCLFTAAAPLAFTTPPETYLQAAKELFSGNFGAAAIAKITLHLKEMAGAWYRLFFLAIVFYAAFKKNIPSQVRMIAWVCLSLHFVNLFIFAVYFRYVYLAWAFTVIIPIFLLWLKVGSHGGAYERQV